MHRTITGRTARMLAAAAGLVACAGAHAGTLYTIDTNTNELQTFDTRTLQFTNVASVGASFNFGNLAYNGSTMYMSQGFGSNLYTLDLSNGNATLVGNTGISDLFGLAFDGSGNLWGGGSTGPQGFYSINPSNGASTLVGNPGVNLDALTYLPTTGQMLGVYAGYTGLYSINTTNGAATLLASEPYINNCGMAYDPDTGLLWVVDWSGQVISINPSTYAATVVLTGQGAHDGLAGLAPAPEPASLLAIGGGLLALARRRRRA